MGRALGLGISEVEKEGKMKTNHDFVVVHFSLRAHQPSHVLTHSSLIPLSIQLDAHLFRRGGICMLMRCEDQPTSPIPFHRFPQESWGIDRNPGE